MTANWVTSSTDIHSLTILWLAVNCRVLAGPQAAGCGEISLCLLLLYTFLSRCLPHCHLRLHAASFCVRVSLPCTSLIRTSAFGLTAGYIGQLLVTIKSAWQGLLGKPESLFALTVLEALGPRWAARQVGCLVGLEDPRAEPVPGLRW